MTRQQPNAGISVGEVAERVGGTVVGDPDVRVHGLMPVEQAGAADLALFTDRRYARLLSGCEAAALLVSDVLADVNPEDVPTRVVCPDPRLALTELLEYWNPLPEPEPGIHPTAVLGHDVELGPGVTVGPYCVIGDHAVLGSGVVLDAHVCVGARARIGAGSRLHPQVVLYPNVVVGERVVLHAGVRLGVDGFGYVLDGHRLRKVPQVGRCVVEDDVEIGANTCIDRGSIGDTIVEQGAKLDNLVHLAHNVRVGSMSLLAAMVGVAGSSRIGRGVAMGGQVGISGHLKIGDGARLGAQSGIIGDIPAGETVSGYPARPHKEYLRAMGHVFRLPVLARRVKALERALEELRTDSDDDH